MPSVPFVPECARRRNYAKAVVPVPVLMLPLISAAYSVLLLILTNRDGNLSARYVKRSAKVAIIGAGPAGSQASVTLTNQGYDVTIYEKEAHPGGWLRNGIPQFRLPQSVLDAEIARIEKMGVTIKCNNEIGKTLTLEQLKAENRAVLVTVGLSSGSGLPLFEHSDVEIAVDFLQRARQAQGEISIPQAH